MASTKPNLKDLEWLHQAIYSQTLCNLHSISFFLFQPTSCCYQETENSIIIHISQDSLSYFSHLLTTFGATENCFYQSLHNLEFHQVNWDSTQIHSLEALLRNHHSVKLLVFQRNRFNLECFRELSKIVTRNAVVKEIAFSESGIGAAGAAILASALKVDGAVEELQIWDDSIESKGAEELSEMIEVNSTLKMLTVFDANPITATPLISAVIGRNREMEVHVWSRDDGGNSSKVVEFVPKDSTLRIYRIDVSGSCRVACALTLNSTVKSLDMSGVRLKSRWAREFRWLLEQNQTLREVKLSKTCLKNKGMVSLAAGLFKNRRLQSLHLDGNWFNGIGLEHLLCPLTRFSALQIQANTTLRDVTFGGEKTSIGKIGLAAILAMLATNESLTRLGIYDDQSLRPQDIVKIFMTLQKNASLRVLSLQGCEGVRGEVLLETIMEVLQVNPWIEDIDLLRTPLQNTGLADRIYQKLGHNGKIEPEAEIDVLKDVALTTPKSCRVFFCGQEYAGKTSLCNSIAQSFSTSFKPHYLDQVRSLVNPVEQAVRKTGMKIRTFIDEEGTKISIWNIAGQQEFYALHDLMFPGHGSASFFFIVSSLFRKPHNREPKTPGEVEEDLQYWLRFVVSNSKKASRQYMLPNVTIILTHFDKIIQPSQNLLAIVDSIQSLLNKFQGYLEFYPTIFTIDSRSSACVSKLTHHLRRTSKTILERVPRVYELCIDLIKVLADWRSENYNKPAMKWREFSELCQVKIPFLRIQSRRDNKEKVEMRRQAIAICLHNIGEVIYFDELELLILDWEWFCSEVLSQLVRLNIPKKRCRENGFISRKELENLLKASLHSYVPGMMGSSSKVCEYMDASDLVKMMLKLELCYEQDPLNSISLLLVPSILVEANAKPQWQLNTSDCIFVGRHLMCDDSSHVSLTPGFFHRLQVRLHTRLIELKEQYGATYIFEKSLISINVNGIHVRVELGGHLGYHIDILACSTKNLTETLRFFNHLIIPTIHSLCSGITLTETILRPDSVKNLTPPRYRKTQFIALHRLKDALLSVPADSMYDYQHTWEEVSESERLILRSGFDFARDLLSDDDFREVLNRRYHDLHNLAEELQIPNEENPDETSQSGSEIVEASFTGIAKGVETVLQRLKMIELEIRDLKQEIQGLRYYEHRLLSELHRKVNFLVTYNVQAEERKTPNMFYFVQTQNYARRIVSNLVPGMDALRLHMLCEYRGEMHVVEDQLGCEIMQVDNTAVRSLAPYTKKFMTLLTCTLRIGAHLVAGMGGMIPDLGRELGGLVDSSLAMGAGGAIAAGALGAAAAGRIHRASAARGKRGDIRNDLSTAQQWMVDFLRERNCSNGKDIAEKFGLWRVRYMDDGQVGWICRRHLYVKAHEVGLMPI